MSVNNQMYKMFNLMKQGYAEKNKDTIEQAARCWMQLAEENPFRYDTPEYEEFFQMKRCFTIYSRKDIDQKINRRKMVLHATKLCALDPEQPYVYDEKAEEEEKRLEMLAHMKPVEKPIEKPVEKVVQEPAQTILGVIPEKESDKKSWLQNFFSRKKSE